MNELSLEVMETARKNEKIILHRLAEVGQTNVAKAMGVDESTVSRMKQNEISKLALFLAALGQIPHQKNSIVLTPEKFFCITEFAKDGVTAFMDDRERLLHEISELRKANHD